jgi:hypothetical protein
MSIHKPRNSREQGAVYLDCLRQLQAEGIDVEIPEEWCQRDRALEIIVAPPAASSVCESRTGGIIYIVLVRLVPRSGLLLTDSDINTRWDNQIVLESFHDQSPVCRFGSAEFCRREVLNHRIENVSSGFRRNTASLPCRSRWFSRTSSATNSVRMECSPSHGRYSGTTSACGAEGDYMARKINNHVSCPWVKSRGADISNCSPRNKLAEQQRVPR